MSDRIRAAQIASESIEFGLRRAPTVLRVVWAPFLLSALIIGGVVGLVFDPEWVAASGASGAAEPAGRGFADALKVPLPVGVAAFAAVALMYGVLYGGVVADISRLVARGEDEGRFVNVRIDAVARRTFAAAAIMWLANLAIFLVALAAAQLVTGVSASTALQDYLSVQLNPDGASGQPMQQNARLAAALGFFGVAFLAYLPPSAWLAAKLSPFVAGTAIENRLIPRKSFALTKGGAWSIFGGLILLIGAWVLIGVVISIGVAVVDGVAALLASIGGPVAFAGAALSFISALGQAAFQLAAFGAQTAFGAIVYRRLSVD
ncbi:MAG: hypothetical protein AAFX08_03050 [Pseudomonadota bacterium]